MTSRRLLKAAEAIREVVSMAILTELRDPRVQNVTVTGVEVAPDMRTAKIKVSVMGSEGQQHLCLNGLNRSSGFLQAKIAKRIDTRYTPRLTFELDDGVKKSLEMARILHELERERAALAAQREAQTGESDRPDISPVDDESSQALADVGAVADQTSKQLPGDPVQPSDSICD